MRRLLSFVAALILSIGFAIAPAFAEKRVALVIGNAAYRNAGELKNSRNDAADMAASLKGLGFKVIEGHDLDKAGMDRIVRDFSDALVGADVGLFFYAGHGLQVAGSNYLVPIDAKLTSPAGLDFEMLRLDIVQRQMEREAKTNVLFLDACRDNPLGRNLARAMGTRSADIGRGLANAESGVGTLISFATQPGNVALDGVGRNSPFTAALLKHIAVAGQDLSGILISVRNDVRAATAGKQVPWENSALTGRFYFRDVPATPVASPGLTADEIAWGFVKDTQDANQLRRFIEQFPTSAWRSEAATRLVVLEQQKVAVVAPPVQPTLPPTPVRPAVGVFSTVRPDKSLSPSEERTLKPKDSFKECDACPQMVVAPAGAFTMGSPASEKERLSDEGPQQRVTFSRQFAVGRFAVTFDEWDACVANGGCNGYQPQDEGWGRGKRPVINVSWDQAHAYVEWLSRKTGKIYRLLSEAEREYVTRAGTTTPFWWGSSISTSQANYNGDFTYGGSKGEYRQRTMPVDSLRPNPWGLFHVHGNVWEWAEDCWYDSHIGAPRDGSAGTVGECRTRILRGGSWLDLPGYLRSASRLRRSTHSGTNFVGLRVARTLAP